MTNHAFVVITKARRTALTHKYATLSMLSIQNL